MDITGNQLHTPVDLRNLMTRPVRTFEIMFLKVTTLGINHYTMYQISLTLMFIQIQFTTLVEMGLGHRIERKRPWLSDKQKADGLKFAQDHIHWTKKDWRYVEFSDEMALQTGTNEGNKYVWRYIF